MQIRQHYVPNCTERFVHAKDSRIIEVCRKQWHFVIECSDYESFHNMLVVIKMLALESWDDFRGDAHE